MTETTQTCGEFTFDFATNEVTGPAEYMAEQGSERLKAISEGRDQVFAMNAQFAPDVITAILVTMQTDYAGWKGLRNFNRMRGAA